MEDKTPITFKKSSVQLVGLSLLIGFVATFLLNHLGKFSFRFDLSSASSVSGGLQSYVTGNPRVSEIIYKSFFGSEISTYNTPYTAFDVGYVDGDFNYFKKVFYYLEGTVYDFIYVILIAIVVYALIVANRKYKFQLT